MKDAFIIITSAIGCIFLLMVAVSMMSEAYFRIKNKIREKKELEEEKRLLRENLAIFQCKASVIRADMLIDELMSRYHIPLDQVAVLYKGVSVPTDAEGIKNYKPKYIN